MSRPVLASMPTKPMRCFGGWATSRVSLPFEERLQLMYDKGERYYEDSPAYDATIEDIDMDAVKAYMKRIGYGKSPMEYLQENKGFLTYKGDMPQVSTACILLFGKRPQNFFPRARVRFIKYNGTEEKVGREMNVIKDVTFEGRILDQIQKTVEYLETQVKEHSYLGEDGLFKTDREYRSSVKELTVCRELFAIGTKEPQYHLVAFIMKATVWANVLEEGQETATSEQKQPDSNQIDSGTTQKLPRNYPETTQKQTLDITPVQEEIIKFILLNPYAGRKEISCSLGSLSEDGVKYNLKVLQHKGIIKRIGPNKGGYWKVLSDETGN